MLSRFLVRSFFPIKDRTERILLSVGLVIIELLVLTFVAAAASMFGGIVGGEEGALDAGLVAMVVYAVVAAVAWILPVKRSA